MTELPANIVVAMAMDLDLPDVYLLCKSSQKFNRILCDNNIFWIKRLQQDYNLNYIEWFPQREYNPKDVYKYYQDVTEENPIEYYEPKWYPLLLKLSMFHLDPSRVLVPGKIYYINYNSLYKKHNKFSREIFTKVFDSKEEAIRTLINVAGYFIGNPEVRKVYGVNSAHEYKENLKRILNEIDNEDLIVYKQADYKYANDEEIYMLYKFQA